VRIGVVAIQGDFERHQLILEKLQIEHIPVRNVDQLKQCDALIIPGGESTTILKLLKASKLSHSIKKFAQKKAIMGTCAGLIVLANKVHNPPMESLQLLDVEVTRNAYGRQIDSFIGDIRISLDEHTNDFEGVFIRAPKIIKVGQGIKSIGFHGKEVVMVENSHILAATFHPELTNDTSIHEHFANKVKKLLS
jgi:5'-phosphate synthase pdxT subunit